MVKWFAACGFKTNPLTQICDSVDAMLAFHHEIEAQRARLDYDIDGVVYKVDRLDWQQRLGFVSRNPRWAHRAQISGREGDDRRQGDRHSGRAHRRAHADCAARAGNRRRRRGVERDVAQRRRDRAPGRAHRRHGDDPARRRRHPAGARGGAGEAAEGVEAVQVSQSLPVFPAHPGGARQHRDRRGGGASPAAPASSPARIRKSSTCKHFVSRRAFDIEGLGEKQIALFFEQGWIREPGDIFTLAARNPEIKLEEQEGFGELSVRNLFNAIEAQTRDRARAFHLCARHAPRRRDHRARARARIRIMATVPRRLREGCRE